MNTVIATRGKNKVLIEVGGNLGRVADRTTRSVYPPMLIDSILARGYWVALPEPVDIPDWAAHEFRHTPGGHEHNQDDHNPHGGEGGGEKASPSGLPANATVADAEKYITDKLPRATVDLTYSNFPISLEMARWAADGIARVAADLPPRVLEHVRVVEVVPIDVPGRFAQVLPDGQTLQISAGWMSSPARFEEHWQKNIEAGFHPKGTDFSTGVIGHEMGHFLMDAVPKPYLTALFDEIYAAGTPSVLPPTFDELMIGRSGQPLVPSEYSNKSGDEHFAEMYAAHLAGTDWEGAQIFEKHLAIIKDIQVPEPGPGKLLSEIEAEIEAEKLGRA